MQLKCVKQEADVPDLGLTKFKALQLLRHLAEAMSQPSSLPWARPKAEATSKQYACVISVAWSVHQRYPEAAVLVGPTRMRPMT